MALAQINWLFDIALAPWQRVGTELSEHAFSIKADDI
jgi:hypothetical protein